ncbi:MAG: hypothetical protein JO061_02285 [Acidobacteriaceae bacterium]|nr:hypothetical protein [Acidobacteriaceae bacterium]
MSLFSSLTSASNSLAAFQNALNVVQNNVSNASTPGYVEQTPTFEAMPFEVGGKEPGGVELGPLQSSRSDYAETSVRNSTAQLGYYEQQVNDLTPLNNQFDLSGNSGVPAAFNSLFTAFSSWASSPNSSVTRQAVINQAQTVASAFNSTAANVSTVAQNTDGEVSNLTGQVNQLAAQLAGYNAQISAGGQLDPSVDAAVNSTLEQLSEVANVMTIKEPDGTFRVMLGGQTELVDGSTVNKLTAAVYVPTTPVVQSGAPVHVPIQITAGVNDALNLKIDGKALSKPITLSPSDTTVAAVAHDINTQLQAMGSTTKASVDSTGTQLVMASGSTGAGASVEILSGTANTTLGLAVNPPPQAQVTDSHGNDVTTEITTGKLAGAIAVRNQILPGLQGDSSQTGSLNELARTFADRVNTVLGVPLFTYDQTSGTSTAATLQINPNVTATNLPSAQVSALTGTASTPALTITPGTNDTVKLQVDGKTISPITLNPADSSLNAVATDLNSQFKSLGIGAAASLDANTGALVLATTNTGPNGSIQILSGNANTTLGLTNTTSVNVASPQVPALAGTAVGAPFAITPGTNDTLNLQVDGKSLSPITLNPADTTLGSVVADLNGQFKSLGIGAAASLDANTGALVLATTNTGPNGSIQVLTGNANATLGLTAATPVSVSSPQVSALMGTAVAAPFTITAGTNDALNLKVDGKSVPGIALNSGDTSLNSVVTDLNGQFKSLGIGATASLNPNTGALVLATTNTGTSGSIQILSGSANATLGLAATTPVSQPAPVSALMGAGVSAPFTITGGTNDALNLQVDGNSVPGIRLNPADTSLSAVVADLNGQFKSQGIGATASLDENTGGFVLATTNTGPGGSIQLLAGSANATLGLGNTRPVSLPSPQLTSLAGTALSPAFTITPKTNDTLNLQVDGKSLSAITLNPADTTLSGVVNDLNGQFKSLGVGATASLDPNSGALVLATTNTGPNGSIQILPGTANATLGLTATTATYQNSANSVALTLAGLANPTDGTDEINGQSFTAYFGSIAGSVGASLSDAKNGQSVQQGLVTQAQSLRQQVSGVDLNQEATRVLQYQMAYQAASKMITVVDDMVQSVLAIIPQSA